MPGPVSVCQQCDVTAAAGPHLLVEGSRQLLLHTPRLGVHRAVEPDVLRPSGTSPCSWPVPIRPTLTTHGQAADGVVSTALSSPSDEHARKTGPIFNDTRMWAVANGKQEIRELVVSGPGSR